MSAPQPEGNWDEYLWMVVCGGLAACFMAWGIGANDVANSFATSVGSGTLKLWQAVIIAGIFEFVGAVALGGETTKTVASGIADVNLYTEFPEIYMYGMLCSLAVAGTWLLLATMWCFAVSTTHSITGSIMGYALVFGGWGGVIWFKEKGDFPFCSGFTPIILSWFFSPIIGGTLSAIIFNFNRFFILRREKSTLYAIVSIPFLVFFTFFINLLFILSKGAKSSMEKKWPCTKSTGYKGLATKDCSDLYIAATWISAACAGGIAIFTACTVVPLLLRKVKRDAEAAQNASVEVTKDVETDVEKVAATANGEEGSSSEGDKPSLQRHESIKKYEVPEEAKGWTLGYHYSKRFASLTHRQIIKGLFYDVHVGASYNDAVIQIHEAAELFKPETESIYSYLQVFSAACVAFAHGSNDVANSIGPFSAIYYVYSNYKLPGSSSVTPKWIFVMGGLGIVVGLATYGYNIIMTIGVQMLKLTPSRGFSAELSAGLTIALASFFGIPVSTTQIIVGCETGVGLCEGWGGVNHMLLLKTFFGWVLTILMAMGFCACLFAMGAYAPSITMSQQISNYNMAIFELSDTIYTDMTVKNEEFESDAAWWTGTPAAPMPYNGSRLETVIKSRNSTYWKAVYDDKKGVRNAMFLDESLWFLNETMSLEALYSTSTIGNTA